MSTESIPSFFETIAVGKHVDSSICLQPCIWRRQDSNGSQSPAPDSNCIYLPGLKLRYQEDELEMVVLNPTTHPQTSSASLGLESDGDSDEEDAAYLVQSLRNLRDASASPSNMLPGAFLDEEESVTTR